MSNRKLVLELAEVAARHLKIGSHRITSINADVAVVDVVYGRHAGDHIEHRVWSHNNETGEATDRLLYTEPLTDRKKVLG